MVLSVAWSSRDTQDDRREVVAAVAIERFLDEVIRRVLDIDGRPYEPTSKQTRLYDKYRKRLDEARPGAAPATEPRP